ncbi:hypothetical protein KC357_g52 [Hortaea werneckii]|nr:hypothetical protein KC357_g52 [Hortaea werneckii]
MPLSKPLRDCSVDFRPVQVFRTAYIALDEAVHESIQVVCSEFSFSVNKYIGALAVRADEDGFVVDLGLGKARPLLDGFGQSVRNAIGEALEDDRAGIGLPIRVKLIWRSASGLSTGGRSPVKLAIERRRGGGGVRRKRVLWPRGRTGTGTGETHPGGSYRMLFDCGYTQWIRQVYVPRCGKWDGSWMAGGRAGRRSAAWFLGCDAMAQV